MKLSTQNQTVTSMIKAGISLVMLGFSLSANAEIVNATYNWTGSGGHSTQGHFSFNNDPIYLNLVTQSNGALKDFNWSAYKDGLQIYSETVVSNSVIDSRNRFLDFTYDVSSNIITLLDTGASSDWFSNNIGALYSSELEIGGLTLSRNEENVIVTLDNAVTAVPEPSTYLMMSIGLILIAGYRQRHQDQA